MAVNVPSRHVDGEDLRRVVVTEGHGRRGPGRGHGVYGDGGRTFRRPTDGDDCNLDGPRNMCRRKKGFTPLSPVQPLHRNEHVFPPSPPDLKSSFETSDPSLPTLTRHHTRNVSGPGVGPKGSVQLSYSTQNPHPHTSVKTFPYSSPPPGPVRDEGNYFL